MEGGRVTIGENCIPGKGTDGAKRAEQVDSSVPCHMRQHRRGRRGPGATATKHGAGTGRGPEGPGARATSKAMILRLRMSKSDENGRVLIHIFKRPLHMLCRK